MGKITDLDGLFSLGMGAILGEWFRFKLALGLMLRVVEQLDTEILDAIFIYILEKS